MTRGVFVTGTDTGVGKTLVACALAAWCRRHGLDAGVMKPIATGGVRRAGRYVSEDALRLARAAASRDPWPLINPVCYREPLAPWTASRRSGRPIRFEPILAAAKQLRARHEVLIVEGVGGWLVPLTARRTVGDLAGRLQLPVVLVARAGLGTLNHTLLSLEAIRRSGLSVLGVILNHAQRPRSSMARLAASTNVGLLRRLTSVPVVGPLAYRPASSRFRQLSGWLEQGTGRRFLERCVRSKS